MKTARFVISIHVLLLLTLRCWSQSGLDAPQPVGAYLDGKFPSGGAGGSLWKVEDAYPNLAFTDPVRLTVAPGNQTEAFVVCRSGEVWRIPHRATATMPERVRFLDLRDRTWAFGDAGLLGMAFHPAFGQTGNANRGYVYLFYQYQPVQPMPEENEAGSYMRISRFTVPDGSAVVDPASEFVLIQQHDRNNFHMGDLRFGGDGMLYIALGDEGADGDELDSAQRINDRFFSGVLRIDVDRVASRSHPIRRQPSQTFLPQGWAASFTQGYSIPNDNPWQSTSGAYLEEFWCIGFRNPHALSFDAATGRMITADVGEYTKEEVNLLGKGKNYQWPFGEGSGAGVKPRPAAVTGTESGPAYEYGRDEGGCIIGGMVYRGSLHSAQLGGLYLFGDRNRRELRAVDLSAASPRAQVLCGLPLRNDGQGGLSGISAGPDGECYLCQLGWYAWESGKIYKLVKEPVTTSPPATLSATGAFTNLTGMTPRTGLLPYSVNSPLFSDNADKGRWIAVPNDGTHNTDAEKIRWSEDGSWDVPPGTVLVKHFALPSDERNASVATPVETRFLVRTPAGMYGVTYKWRADGSDADLVPGNDKAFRDVTIFTSTGGTRTQRWNIPTRADCMSCHNENTGLLLGLTARQMDRSQFFQLTGRTANQLRTYNALGMFTPALREDHFARLRPNVPLTDPASGVEHRMRSYLDSNCSHCHRPGGVPAQFDARSSRAPVWQQIINGAPRSEEAIVSSVLLPGSYTGSLLHQRITTLGAARMPQIARSLPDNTAIAALEEWIRAAPADYPSRPVKNNLALLPGVVASQSSTTGSYTADRAVDDGFRGDPLRGTVSMTQTQSQPWWQADLGAARYVERIRIWGRWDAKREALNGAWLMVSDTPFDSSPVETQLARAGVSAFRIIGVGAEATDFSIRRTARYVRIQHPGTGQLAFMEVEVMGATSAPSIPSAQPDTLTVAARGTGIVNVLANDSGHALYTGAVQVVTPPAYGTVVIDSSNDVLHYTHSGGGTGTDSFSYRVSSADGVWSAPAAVNITVTGLSSSRTYSTSLLTTAASTVTGPFTVNITFSSPVTGLEKWDFDVTNATLDKVLGSGSDYTMRVNPITPGEVKLSLGYGRAANQSDLGNLASNVLSVNFTTGTNPSVALSTPATTVTGPFTVNIHFSEPVTGLEKLDFDSTNATLEATSGSGAAYSMRVTPVSAGLVTLYLSYGHAASAGGSGNLPSNVLNVTYAPGSSSNPGATISAQAASTAGAFDAYVKFTKAVTGLEAPDFTVTNATVSRLSGAGSNYTVTLTPLGFGDVSLFLPAWKTADASGAGNLASNTLTVRANPWGNHPPVISLPGDQISRRGSPAGLQCSATDADGDAIQWYAWGLPPGLSINSVTGAVTGTPTTAGAYPVTLAVTDPHDFCRVKFTWTVVEPRSGLTARYFAGTAFESELLARVDPAVNFAWGASPPGPGLPEDNFSVRWTGCVVPLYSQNYVFFVNASHGVRLTLNGQRIIDSWTSTGGERSGFIRLQANQPAVLSLEYFHATGSAYCELRWASGSQPRQIIPESRLMVNESGATLPAANLSAPDSAVYRLAMSALQQKQDDIVSCLPLESVIQCRLPAGIAGAAVFGFETSHDLSAWQPLASPQRLPDAADGSEIWQSPAPPSGAKRFYRLRLTPR